MGSCRLCRGWLVFLQRVDGRKVTSHYKVVQMAESWEMARSCHVKIKLSRLRCKNHYCISKIVRPFEGVSVVVFVTGYIFKLIK
jgi:hypothetical protein